MVLIGFVLFFLTLQEYRYYRSLQREGKSISQGFLEDLLDKRIKITGFLWLFLILQSLFLILYTAKIRQIDVETEHRAKLVDVIKLIINKIIFFFLS